MKNLQSRLKQGETLFFDNELFCQENESDDFRCAECVFSSNGFKMSFNGGFYSYKTFNAFQNKLNQLTNDFNLTFNETETNEYNN